MMMIMINASLCLLSHRPDFMFPSFFSQFRVGESGQKSLGSCARGECKDRTKAHDMKTRQFAIIMSLMLCCVSVVDKLSLAASMQCFLRRFASRRNRNSDQVFDLCGKRL